MTALPNGFRSVTLGSLGRPIGPPQFASRGTVVGVEPEMVIEEHEAQFTTWEGVSTWMEVRYHGARAVRCKAPKFTTHGGICCENEMPVSKNSRQSKKM